METFKEKRKLSVLQESNDLERSCLAPHSFFSVFFPSFLSAPVLC